MSEPSRYTCEVCGRAARGFNFGVKTCRACSAFFRRALAGRKNKKNCEFRGDCVIFDGERYSCKSCRLAKCQEVGMVGEALPHLSKLPPSLESFVGRPSLVIFCTKNVAKNRTFIDVKQLVAQGLNILSSHSRTPWSTETQLQKLTIASEGLLNTTKPPKLLTRVSRAQTMEMFKFDFLSTATWLTHFDDFRLLPSGVQMKMLKTVWHVWGRLYNATQTAKLKRSLDSEPPDVELLSSGKIYVDLKKAHFDVSWLSSYPADQLFNFLVYFNGQSEFYPIIELIKKLEPTHTELTYMFAQLCFEYAASRHSGEIRDICDKFQQVLADDLHNYYYEMCTSNPKVVNYAGRLAQLMKVNRDIQQSIRRFREKTHIARTFDIFTADFSHPDMFVDIGY